MSNKVWEKVFMIFFCVVVAKFEKTNLVVFLYLGCKYTKCCTNRNIVTILMWYIKKETMSHIYHRENSSKYDAKRIIEMFDIVS